MSKEFDTDYTNQPVCPHCGCEARNAWEINFGPGCEGDTEITCGSCEEEYFASRQCSVTYSTSKIIK